tara:strand:+ start:771 stop:1121 length:351 start_codon:yes stop_codon:yes gene_type:complete
MKKPPSGKVQFGICEHCYQHLSAKGDLLTETFLDACVYHIHTGYAIPYSILEDRYPIHIEYIIKQLEIEKYIISHETEQGLYVKPFTSGKHNSLPIYCANRFLGCSKVFSEHKTNE